MYHIHNRRDLLDKLHRSTIYSKFDMKSDYGLIQIAGKDRYKTVFNVPFGIMNGM